MGRPMEYLLPIVVAAAGKFYELAPSAAAGSSCLLSAAVCAPMGCPMRYLLPILPSFVAAAERVYELAPSQRLPAQADTIGRCLCVLWAVPWDTNPPTHRCSGIHPCGPPTPDAFPPCPLPLVNPFIYRDFSSSCAPRNGCQ